MSTTASGTSVATHWQGGNPYLLMCQQPSKQAKKAKKTTAARSGAKKRASCQPPTLSACAWKVASRAIYAAWENTPYSDARARLTRLRREIDVLIRASY